MIVYLGSPAILPNKLISLYILSETSIRHVLPEICNFSTTSVNNALSFKHGEVIAQRNTISLLQCLCVLPTSLSSRDRENLFFWIVTITRNLLVQSKDKLWF